MVGIRLHQHSPAGRLLVHEERERPQPQQRVADEDVPEAHEIHSFTLAAGVASRGCKRERTRHFYFYTPGGQGTQLCVLYGVMRVRESDCCVRLVRGRRLPAYSLCDGGE